MNGVWGQILHCKAIPAASPRQAPHIVATMHYASLHNSEMWLTEVIGVLDHDSALWLDWAGDLG